MGTIKVHEFTTLDGSVGAPMWTMGYPFTEQMTAAVGPLTASSSAILLGRTTYEMFGPVWSTRTIEEDPGAEFFNNTRKYVVSSTLEKGDWEPATILGGYDAEKIREFKDGIDGGIYISGSATLVRALIADRLVDELHLFVYPVAVGEGPRLFPEGGPQTTMALLGAQGLDNGVVHLTYGPAAA